MKFGFRNRPQSPDLKRSSRNVSVVEVSEPMLPVTHRSISAPPSTSSSTFSLSTSNPTLFTSTKARFSRRLGSRSERSSYPLPSSFSAPPLWLPLIDFLCCCVEKNGKDKVGIFRTSASAHTVRQLLKACQRLHAKQAHREEMELLFAPHANEVDVVASVLKAYLREQSHPLIPVSFYDAFLSTAGGEDNSDRLDQLKFLVRELPTERRLVLHRFIVSLHRIQENQEENKMDASNLAIVFGPSLLRGENEGLDMLKIRAQCLVVETCITHHAAVFEEAGDEDTNDGSETLEMAHDVAAVDEEHDGDGDEPTTLVPHHFKKDVFRPFSPAICRHCSKSTFGLRKAYKCQGCDYAVHSRCRESVGDTCTGVAWARQKLAPSQPGGDAAVGRDEAPVVTPASDSCPVPK